MKQIKDLFGQPTFAPKKRRTERGDLLVYFADKLNIGRAQKKLKDVTPASVGFWLTGFTLHDLYYLKSSCDDAERRGTPWGARFWTSIREKKNDKPRKA